ncbi:hypothetical protein FQR65_LT20027 [Abscondita terminalis]|nr:hypothetical protein FQR65_LT20027 [Abscondita terminalis]
MQLRKVCRTVYSLFNHRNACRIIFECCHFYNLTFIFRSDAKEISSRDNHTENIGLFHGFMAREYIRWPADRFRAQTRSWRPLWRDPAQGRKGGTTDPPGRRDRAGPGWQTSRNDHLRKRVDAESPPCIGWIRKKRTAAGPGHRRRAESRWWRPRPAPDGLRVHRSPHSASIALVLGERRDGGKQRLLASSGRECTAGGLALPRHELVFTFGSCRQPGNWWWAALPEVPRDNARPLSGIPSRHPAAAPGRSMASTCWSRAGIIKCQWIPRRDSSPLGATDRRCRPRERPRLAV